jgi:DNA (cytosine-5)-methyltransferase 1
MNELALFAGAGGGILGGKLLGWRTVCAVEYDTYAASILVARQNDGCFEAFPVWDDVRTFDGRPWRRTVDVVSGGFPCTDISASGRGAGIEGRRSGLWREMARIVREVQPRFVFVENSPLLVRRGLAVVLGDLAQMGYDARWGIVGAHHVAAPHKRDRIWIVAQPDRTGLEERAESNQVRCQRRISANEFGGTALQQEWSHRSRAQWASDAGILRVANGVPKRVDRIRAIGNAQVPAVAALAWRLLGGPTA